MDANFWCGIIWATVMGLAVGNYACSLIHRLPRGRLILDKKPYCGSCGALLQVKDLFPVVSALLLKHRCRYCKAPYPITHTITELFTAALFVGAYVYYGFGELYVLLVALGTFLIIQCAIEGNEKRIMPSVMICIAVIGMILRTLVDASIFGFVHGGLYALIIAAFIWRKQMVKDGHIYRLPPPALLFALGGLCVGGHNILYYFAAYLLCTVLFWRMSARHSIAFTISVIAAIVI